MTRQSSRRLSVRTLALAGLCLGMAALTVDAPAHADVIVSYGFPAGSSTSTSSPAANVHADVSASAYTAHGGTQIGTTGSHHLKLEGSIGNATLADAILNEVYGQFAVTVTPDTWLNLSSLTFGMRNDRGSDGETFTVHLRSSLDDYAADIASLSQGGDSDITTVQSSESFDLSGAAFQHLTGTTTFRLYMVSDIAANPGSKYIRIMPDVVLNGTTSGVPEPGTFALAGLGGLLVLRRRRGVRSA